MSGMMCIDSKGWIERLSDGPKSSRYNKIIDAVETEEIITPVIVLYEVYKKIKKIRGEEVALEAIAALSQTNVVTIDRTIALEAADYSLEYGLHMADALVYASARHHSAQLYTSDDDLKGLNGVTFI